VFQNGILLEGTTRLLREDGFTVHRGLLTAPNDGTVCLGQAVVARMRRSGRRQA
jgi:hydrogenase maturation factor HypF (carbamoyltransferase family)